MTATDSKTIPSNSELGKTKFKATIDGGSQAIKFKALIDGAFGLLAEFHLMANESGLWLRQLDSSKAALFDIKIDAKFFREYIFESDHEEVMFCLPADVVTRLVKKANAKTDKIELELIHRRDDERLSIAVYGEMTLREKLVLLTPPDDYTKKPNLSPMSTCHVNAKELQGYIREASKAKIPNLKISIRDRVQYTESKNGEAIQYPRGLTIEGENDETEIFYELPDECSVWDIWVTQSQTQTVMVAGNYLSEIMKVFAKDDELKVQVTNNKPLIIEMSSIDGRRILYIQAPRVERR